MHHCSRSSKGRCVSICRHDFSTPTLRWSRNFPSCQCYQEAVACRDALATAEKTAEVAKLEEAKSSLEFQAVLLWDVVFWGVVCRHSDHLSLNTEVGEYVGVLGIRCQGLHGVNGQAPCAGGRKFVWGRSHFRFWLQWCIPKCNKLLIELILWIMSIII